LSFVDNDDLEMGRIGGILEWTAPANISAVTQYVIYLADQESDGSRSQLAISGSLENSSAVSSQTGISTDHGTSVNYTYFLVYTRSSLLEQTTPAALAIYDDFLFVCDELSGITCGEPGANAASAGAGKCTTSSGCQDCGLTAARLSSVKQAVTKGTGLTLIGAAGSDAANVALMKFNECGLSAEETFYKARGMANPAISGSPQFMCRYGCLANLTSCRQCSPYSDNSSVEVTDTSADADGLSVWRYLACRYRNIEDAGGDDLKYAYVFGNGQFVGLGDELEDKVSCDDMALATASGLLPFDISNMGCNPSTPGASCLLSVVNTEVGELPSTEVGELPR